MPAKMLSNNPHTAADPPEGKRVRWFCKTGHFDWTPYSESDSAIVEAAFQKKDKGSNKVRVPVSGGAYVINLHQLLQYKSDDALKQRPVKRVFEDGTPITAAVPKGSPKKTAEAKRVSEPTPDESVITIDDEPSTKKTRTHSPPLPSSSKNSAAPTVAPVKSIENNDAPAVHTGPMTRNRQQEAALEAAQHSDPKATSIDMVRFAKSIFHCVVPTPNAASAHATPIAVTMQSADINTTHEGAQGPQIVADPTYRAQLQLFARLLKRVPLINRSSLSDSAAKCRPNTKAWLNQIGRIPKHKGVFLMLNKPLQQQDAAQPVALTPMFSTTVGHLQKLAARSVFTVVGGSNFQRTGSLTDVANPDSVLVVCSSANTTNPLSPAEHLASQLMLLSGPVLMCVDNDFSPVKNPPEFIACSIPGINFAYSDADQKAFLSMKSKTGDAGEGYVVNELKAVERMRLIWAHTLAVMDSVHQVQIACMCAIGCGAFKGYFGTQIPRLWGRALALALTHFKQDPRDAAKFLKTSYDITPHHNSDSASQQSATSSSPYSPTNCGTFKHLESVIVSLPTFGADNNFHAFSSGLRTCLKEIAAAAGIINLGHLPVLLVEDASMTTTASYCAAIEKKRVGILNPSDVQAIRHGWVGMYWDGGHVALEELLAMTTTLLVQHVGLDRELYTTAKRRFIVGL